ncbi:unnamed protein product [Onchocerca flexuosa]|uniref:UV-stimulated scaffold protein A n=1 Tax=Onchocerca flexuosa TaxID=387005 RepID=A0A183H176_9BILA|nr:unnamed protein product [Onchocerca flexuosa]
MFDFNKRLLNEHKLKELKQILKSNPDIIEPIFTDFLKYFRQNNCEYRLAVLQLCNEFFQRSHVFRVQLTNHIQEVLLYTIETDPIHYPLPSPREAAKILKLETLKLVKLWHEKYAEAYPKLDFSINFLRSSKSLDFEHASAELQVERQRAEEANRKKDEQSKRMIEKVEREFRERQEEISRYINETRHALELLVPRFDVNDDTDIKIHLGCETEMTHGYDMLDSVAVTVPLNAPIVNVNAENEIIINALIDCLELDYKPPEELPEYILKQTMEKKDNNLPGPSAINGVQKPPYSSQDHKNYDNHENKVPILLYGLDLKYWGENDIKPAEVPRNNADCHRFWRPSDESCSTNFDTTEAYHSRVMTFVGQQLKGSRQCRASLSDGTLCPRMDLKRCPLHGKIIDRDEMGYPMNEIIQKPYNSKDDSKEEEEYIRDVEVAIGVNLRGKIKGGKSKRQDDINSNPSAAVRNRLSVRRC